MFGVNLLNLCNVDVYGIEVLFLLIMIKFVFMGMLFL